MRARRAVGPALSLALFALLAAIGGSAGALDTNVAVTRWLQGAIPSSVAEPITAVLVLGASPVTLVLLGGTFVLLVSRGERLAALSLGLIAVGLAVELVLKGSLHHPAVWEEFYLGNPNYPLPEIKPAVELRSPFPSGHTLRVTFVALAWAGIARQDAPRAIARSARMVACLLCGCVAASVVYLGWHWATDALGGLTLGYVLAAGPSWALSRGTAHQVRGSTREGESGAGGSCRV